MDRERALPRLGGDRLIAVFALPFVCFAAPETTPPVSLVRPLSSATDDIGAAVANAGNILVISGSATDERGRESALLFAVDRNGDERWRKTLDGGGEAALWSVEALSDGSTIAAGWERSEKTGLDALFVRVDVRGVLVWRRTIALDGDQRLWSHDVRGETILAGGESVMDGVTRSFTAKLDLAGEVTWTRTHGEKPVERCFAVRALEDGGYVLAGMNGSGPRESAGYDGFVARHDRAGKRTWERMLGGDGFDVVHDIARLADGSLVVAGYGDKGGEHGFDGFLARLSASGEVEWRREFGDANDDRVVHLEALQKGGFALVGYSRSKNSEADIVVRGVDEHGNQTWESRLGGDGAELGRAACEGRSGALYVVGHSRSYARNEQVLLARFSHG